MNTDEALGFLSALYRHCEGDVEFRLLGGVSARSFYLSLPVRALPDALVQSEADIYFGVATRSGGDRKPVQLPACWVDIDFKQQPGGLLDPKHTVMLRLIGCELQPSIIVSSGHGYHAYWLWREPVAPSDHGGVETINRKLQIKLKGDSCGDAGRILRLPGSLNRKGIEVPCAVVSSSSRAYEPRELADWLADVELPRLSPKAQAMISQGYPADCTDRSRADYFVVRELLACGFSPDYIREVFESSPIGERYREKQDAGGYLDRTISNAQQTIGVSNEQEAVRGARRPVSPRSR